MPKWKGGFDGRGRTIPEFQEWLEKQPKPEWIKGITTHNTGVPGIRRAREIGWSSYVRNAGSWYRAAPPRGRGWSGGPHFFISEEPKVYNGTPITVPGVHDPCHNRDHIGIEQIANFNLKEDDDDTGPGLIVKDACAQVEALLLTWLDLPISSMTFHKECKRTTHDCPGKDEDKAEFVGRVQAYMAALVAEHDPTVVPEIDNPTTYPTFDNAHLELDPPYPEELDDRPRWGVRLFRDLGWSKVAACALVGGFQQEAYPDLRTDAASGGSIGLAQWLGDRRETFIRFCQERGTDTTEFESNFLFADWELRHSEKRWGNHLKRDITLWSACRSAIGYERPRGWSVLNPYAGSGWQNRLNNAIALNERLS